MPRKILVRGHWREIGFWQKGKWGSSKVKKQDNWRRKYQLKMYVGCITQKLWLQKRSNNTNTYNPKHFPKKTFSKYHNTFDHSKSARCARSKTIISATTWVGDLPFLPPARLSTWKIRACHIKRWFWRYVSYYLRQPYYHREVSMSYSRKNPDVIKACA